MADFALRRCLTLVTTRSASPSPSFSLVNGRPDTCPSGGTIIRNLSLSQHPLQAQRTFDIDNNDQTTVQHCAPSSFSFICKTSFPACIIVYHATTTKGWSFARPLLSLPFR